MIIICNNKIRTRTCTFNGFAGFLADFDLNVQVTVSLYIGVCAVFIRRGCVDRSPS